MNKLIEISPSMFFQFAKSPHWIWYDINGDWSKKNPLPELTLRLIEGGVLHEEDCVKEFTKVPVDKNQSEEDAEAITLQHMRNGEELIYQGVISYKEKDVKYKGRPDFLRKCHGASSFGDYYYQPVEIKNSTKCDKTEYKKQLMFYALILENIQGYRPTMGSFINKLKQEVECEFTEKLLNATKDTVNEILSILRGKEPLLKITRDALDTPWGEELFNEALRKSDIALLYNISAYTVSALKNQRIETINAMSTCDIDLLPKIKGAPTDTLKRLKLQAKSLADNEIITLSDTNLPTAITNIYFDIEGDPLLGIDYLFGFLISTSQSVSEFKYFIAETPAQEEKMWNEFLLWLNEQNYHDYKVYHYHHYEKTHLNLLSKKYGGSEQLEQFISNLVDLSIIITTSYIFPVYFYSIKDIAKHLNFQWQHAKAGGAQSIFWYEEWLEKGDTAILQDIINYNEDDVRATEFLYHWLKEKEALK